MPQTISPLDVLTSDGKYPERQDSDECTTQVRINAADTAERTSRLLDYLDRRPPINSGFRTRYANAQTKGAKNSPHLKGEAVDLEDLSGELSRLITSELLERFDLYMENPQHTKGRVHLQIRRPGSGNRIFNP